MPIKYRLHYLADADDMNWKTYESETPVQVGDVIQLSCGYYHQETEALQQKTGIRLEVSKSCQSVEEAIMVREQLGHTLKL